MLKNYCYKGLSMKKLLYAGVGRIILLLLCAVGMLHGVDTPVAYKPTMHAAELRNNPENWVANFGISYGQGSARRSWDGIGRKVDALSLYGVTNITRLGMGLQSFTGKAVTGQYWNATNNGLFDYLTTQGTDGQIAFTGKMEATHCDLNIEQNIVAGFFAQLSLPVRNIKVSHLGYVNQGSATITNATSGTTTIATFMDNVLPTILLENGFTNGLFAGYSKTTLPEAMVLFGWQGSNNKSFGIIDEASGRLQAGVIIPLAGQSDQDVLFSMPVAYDGFWGVHSRFDLEVGLWKMLVLGGRAGLSVFMSDSRDMRVYTDCGYGTIQGPFQSGWINLQKAHVAVDKGAIWDLELRARLQNFLWGFFAQASIAYARQEDSHLHARDSQLLQRVVTAAAALTVPVYLSVDALINKDPKLKAWERLDLGFLIGYDFKKHAQTGNFTPAIQLEYLIPLSGKRAMVADMLAGGISLQVAFDF